MGSVLQVSFSALTLLVRGQEGHQAHKKSVPGGKLGERANRDLPEKWLLKLRWTGPCILHATCDQIIIKLKNVRQNQLTCRQWPLVCCVPLQHP